MRSQSYYGAAPDVSSVMYVHILSDVTYATFSIFPLLTCKTSFPWININISSSVCISQLCLLASRSLVASARLGFDSVPFLSVCRSSSVTEPRDSITVQVCLCAFYRLFHISSRRPVPVIFQRVPAVDVVNLVCVRDLRAKLFLLCANFVVKRHGTKSYTTSYLPSWWRFRCNRGIREMCIRHCSCELSH